MPRAQTVPEAAAAYAARGIPVFPCWGIANSRCDCGKECDSPGKHPLSVLVKHGVKESTLDQEQIRRWWAAYPNANIGAAMGDLVAIDEDLPGSLAALGLDIPNCPTQRTGSGQHYIFKANGHPIRNRWKFAPGLDCRADGGYIIMAPSLHLSGKHYQWIAGHSLEDLEPPDIPDALAKLTVDLNGGTGDERRTDQDLFGRLKLEALLSRLEAMEQRRQDGGWREPMLRLVASLVARKTPDELILSLCRRATWTKAGYTHADTDAWVLDCIRNTRQRWDIPEPDEETFDQVDGEAPQPDGCKGATVKPRHTDWLWHPYFPAGELALLGAKGGVGKGQATASVVARLTTGILWPDGSEKAPAGHVLWAEAEDSINKTVVPRLIANRADLGRVTFFNEEDFAALDLRRFVKEHDSRAIVLSPIMSFLPKLKSHIDELAVGSELRKLRAAVDGTLCALIGIAHLNKKSDLDAIERLLGSVAFANFVRSVVLLASDKDQKDVRRWVHAKHNLSVRGDDLLFQTKHVGEDPRDQFVKVEWQIPGGDNIDVDSFFDRKQRQTDQPQSAHEWIVSYLEGQGRSLAKDVMQAGIKAGHSDSALRNAQYRSTRIGHEHEGFPAQVWWYVK
jgi:hypothetical protein